MSSAGRDVAAPGRSRACADDAHRVCGHVSFASPPVPGHHAESTIVLCRCSCHRACPLARRKEAVPVTVWQRRCACPVPRTPAHSTGTQENHYQDLRNSGTHSSASHGNAPTPGRTRSKPPAAPRRGRPATRYATCTSANCERGAWRYLQNHFSKPPSTCSAAILAPGSGGSGKRRCAHSPMAKPQSTGVLRIHSGVSPRKVSSELGRWECLKLPAPGPTGQCDSPTWRCCACSDPRDARCSSPRPGYPAPAQRDLVRRMAGRHRLPDAPRRADIRAGRPPPPP